MQSRGEGEISQKFCRHHFSTAPKHGISNWRMRGAVVAVIGPLILFSLDQSLATSEPINTSFRSLSLSPSSPHALPPSNLAKILLNFKDSWTLARRLLRFDAHLSTTKCKHSLQCTSPIKIKIILRDTVLGTLLSSFTALFCCRPLSVTLSRHIVYSMQIPPRRKSDDKGKGRASPY